MKKFFLLFLLFLIFGSSFQLFAQSGTPAGANSGAISGGSGSGLPSATVATLPAASSNTNKTYLVTDGTSASDCTVGGGSTRAVCASNGAAWVSVGGGSGLPANPPISPPGVVQVVGESPSGGVAGTPTWFITGSRADNVLAGASDTLRGTDRGGRNIYTNAGAVAVTLPQVSAAITNTALSGGQATYTAANNLSTGQYVSVTGTTNGGGIFNVANKAVNTASGTQFTIVMAGTQGSAADTGAATRDDFSGSYNLLLKAGAAGTVTITPQSPAILLNGTTSVANIAVAPGSLCSLGVPDFANNPNSWKADCWPANNTAGGSGIPGGADTGAANAYVIPATGATLTTGQFAWFTTTHANTGTSTINVASLGVINITKKGANALVSGDILSGVEYLIEYDGTQWQLLNPSFIVTGNVASSAFANVASRNTSLGTTALVASAASASNGGPYLVGLYAYDSAAGTSCSGNTTITWTIAYTDPTGTAQTQTATETITTNGGTTGGDKLVASFVVGTNGGNAINYSTSYSIGGSCSPGPSYAATLKALQ